MPTDQTEKIDSRSDTPSPADAPPRTGRGRLRPQVWPMDTGQSEDTFATPSQKAAGGDIDPNDLSGPEPAVFGGATPNPDEQPGQTAPAEENQPLGTALDESVRGNDILADAPHVNIGRLARSTPFLLSSMLACLIGSTFFIQMAVPTETYVQITVKFQNYDQLNELELQELQVEMNNILRTYPLRSQAWDLLQRKSPGVPPGFLNSGLTFHRFDAISWDPNGIVRLRIDSDDPATDITRLSAVTDAFYVELKARTKKLDEFKADLAKQTSIRDKNLEHDAQLKAQIDGLLPEAQRYMDLKQNMQALERYLEVVDDTNPYQMVARQNLQRISGQVDEARQHSLQRDELLGERVALQKDNETVVEEIARLSRAIEVFAYPEAPDPSSLIIYDTRDKQKIVMRSAWVGVILFFAGLIGAFHLADHRAAERYRRERREMLKLKSRASEARAPVAP